MASSSTIPCRHILVTGPPGVGKTTLVKSVYQSLVESSYPIKGFYTEEVRSGGRRSGFDVVTLDQNRGSLARISEPSGLPGGRRDYRVGQYSVNLQSFEQTALPSLKIQEHSTKSIYLIDEIGKMELFSSVFIHTVRQLFNHSDTVVLATIPVPKGKPIPLVEEVRNRKDAIVFQVSKQNRDSILKVVLKAVTDCFDNT